MWILKGDPWGWGEAERCEDLSKSGVLVPISNPRAASGRQRQREENSWKSMANQSEACSMEQETRLKGDTVRDGHTGCLLVFQCTSHTPTHRINKNTKTHNWTFFLSCTTMSAIKCYCGESAGGGWAILFHIYHSNAASITFLEENHLWLLCLLQA